MKLGVVRKPLGHNKCVAHLQKNTKPFCCVRMRIAFQSPWFILVCDIAFFFREAAARKKERQRRQEAERKTAIRAAEALRRRQTSAHEAKTGKEEVRFATTSLRHDIQPASATAESCASLSFSRGLFRTRRRST